MANENENPNTYSVSLAKRQLVDSIWKSAGIEGLGTTFPNTEKILENIPVQTTRDEVLFIVNMKRAWEFLLDNLKHPNNLMLLREMNRICMDGLLYDAGAIRKGIVTIGGCSYVPPVPHEAIVAEELQKLTDYTDKTEQALDTFCYLARAQVFTDGNKRLAQLMCNKVLIENDLGIFSIPYDSIGLFKELLVDFYDTNNSAKIKQFFKERCLLLNPYKEQRLNSDKPRVTLYDANTSTESMPKTNGGLWLDDSVELYKPTPKPEENK